VSMSAAELLRQLASQGIELWHEGERVRFRAPKGALGNEQRAELAARRPEILAELRRQATQLSQSFPLSFSQRSLWFLHQQAPDSTAYHVAMSTRILSPVQIDALRQAVQAMHDRHAVLRTTYDFIDGSLCQRVAGAVTARFEVHDVGGISDDALRERVEADYRQPFDLARGPVMRTSLFTRVPDDHVLLMAFHHIAVDAWSLLTLFQEVGKLYEEFCGGPPAGLPRPVTQYTDYAAWQEQMLAGPEGERLWDYWRSQLAPPRPPLVLPADHDRPALQTLRGSSVEFELTAAVSEKLKAVARAEGATAFVVLLASFHAFLHRLTGHRDIIVGTPTFARSKPEFLSVVGDFVNSVPLRARLDGKTTGRTLIAQLREALLGALDAQELPLPLMVERLQPERESGRTPLFDTFFVLQRFDQFRELETLLTGGTGIVQRGPLRFGAYPLVQQEGQFDLALLMVERAGVLHGVLTYNTDVLEAATVTRWTADYAALVTAFLEDPQVSLESLPQPWSPRARAADAASLLATLEQRDIRLSFDGEKLKVNAPKGALDNAARALITDNKAELIAAVRKREGAANGGVRRLDRGGPLPVSAAQRRLWFLDRIEPGRSEYNIGLAIRMRGSLDESILRRALDWLVNRHESLHLRVVESDGNAVAEILPAAPADLEVVDLLPLSAAERPVALDQRIAECLRKPFQIAQGPLCRFQLIRVAPQEYALTLSVHHIVADGWSVAIVIEEMCRIYDAMVAGREPGLAPLPVQYPDYAAWEVEQLSAGRMGPHLAFWKRELAGAPVLLDMPVDRPRPAAQSFRGGHVYRSFDTELLRKLKETSRQQGATVFMTLLAAWQVLLHRYSGQEEVIVGTPVANRSLPVLEGLVGCLVNNVALRGNLAGKPSFSEYLSRVKRSTLDAFEHAELPFDVVVESLNPPRTASHAPFFQVLFTFMSFPTQVTPPAGIQTESIDSSSRAARFDITVELIELDGRLKTLYEYATDLFDEATIERLHLHFESLLRAIVAHPSQSIGDLPLLTPVDEKLLLSWNDTAVEHDRSRCVHHLLEATARRRPEAIAVSDAGQSLTYVQLEEGANRLAALLIERGVEPGDLVGVCLDRTADMPVALAAVLKVGAAYVPLDPTHPAERLSYTLQDAGVTCVITLARFVGHLADANAPLLALDELREELSKQPATPPPVACKSDDLAYVIYTSGSTGRPKGVEVEHRNVVAFLEAMRREPGLVADDVLLAVTTLSFDIAGLEMWLPLTVGARIVIASRSDVLDGQRLAELLDAERVSVLQATPATWRLMIEAGWTGRAGLKALCGGEALPRDLAISLLERVGELWNVYGPTETTIWSTVNRVRDPRASIPIGHPIANTRVYVLEPSGQPAPVGVAGELCIAGEGVARGYRNRPDLTAEKFATIALPSGLERVYRTGDMARLRVDGQLEFLGRRDTQVKVRGYRIELGEIEAILATHTGVKECVVVVREDIPGDQRLVGYVVLGGDTAFDVEAARRTLRTKLPEYMVPNLFMTLSALPLTPNGKIDRKALPPPQTATQASEAAAAADVLMTPEQRRVAGVWCEVLQVNRVGLYENFFDLGGHSLLLVKLQGALKKEFRSEIALVDLFQRTTVAAQAERLSATPASSDALKRAQARAVKQVHA
jgi:amino acid adenylation domain-containing protein